MTRDDIIRLAREAGLEETVLNSTGEIKIPYSFFTRFAALVAAAEREACARVCEAYKFTPAAEAIRARAKIKNTQESSDGKIN